jgi:hypothetical protein
LGWARLSFVLWVAASSACYRPNITSCGVHCGDHGECPRSLSCVDGWCSDIGPCSGGDAALAPEDRGGPDAPAAEVAHAPDAPAAAPDASDGPSDIGRVEIPPQILPSTIGDLELWLDPDRVESTGSSFVRRDRSDLHNDATAPPGASPALVPEANGLPPAVELSGAGQYLALPEGIMRVVGRSSSWRSRDRRWSPIPTAALRPA